MRHLMTMETQMSNEHTRSFRFRRCLLVLACTLSLGCAGADRSADRGRAGMGVLASQQDGAELIERFDLNGDGLADVWKVSLVTPASGEREETRVTVRKELDINFDGRVDITKYYTQSEEVEREEMDLDFDGRVDAVNFYTDGALQVREIDMEFDGQVEVWKFYDRGQLVRKERDTNADGRVDSWEYYKEGELKRIGIDRDGDGEPEVFEGPGGVGVDG